MLIEIVGRGAVAAAPSVKPIAALRGKARASCHLTGRRVPARR
jgi:hypothetical protein